MQRCCSTVRYPEPASAGGYSVELRELCSALLDAKPKLISKAKHITRPEKHGSAIEDVARTSTPQQRFL